MKRGHPIILLVEDNDLDAEKVTRAYDKLALVCPIVRARDGFEALQTLRALPVPNDQAHVVLLDLNMPRMNGLEFLAELRADDSIANASVFVLTTSGRAADRVEAERHDVDGYLVKPRTVSEMVEILRHVTGMSERGAESRAS